MNGLASDQMVTASWVLLGVYAATVLFFVVRGALRTRSMDDYGVGSIKFSPVAVGLSLAASMMSAATFIINPGLIALYGISGVISMVVVLPIATLVSFVVITKGFRKFGKSVKATTLSQWIGARFESPGYSLFFAFLSLLLITFIVLICVGLTKVVSKALNAGELWVLVGIVVFIFGYMMFGGANSLVYTNTIQGGGITAGDGSDLLRNNIEDGDGWGINTSGTVTLTYNRVVGCAKGVNLSGGEMHNNLIANSEGIGLQVNGNVEVISNTLTGNSGSTVKLVSGIDLLISGNNLEGNLGDYDIENLIPKTTLMMVLAQGNWWGTTSSSEINRRIYDFNEDYNLGQVIYQLVAEGPIQTAPAYVRSVTMDPPSPVGIQTV